MPTTDKLLQSAHDETAHDALVVAKQRQASYYDRGAKPRPPLSVEDTVRAQWDSNSNWEKAEVTKVLPHRSYQLRLKTAPRNGEHQSMCGSRASHRLSFETNSTGRLNTAVSPPPADDVAARADNPNHQQRPQPPTTTAARTVMTRSDRHMKCPASYADYVTDWNRKSR